MSGDTTDPSKITSAIARNRPELATLILVVAMFLTAEVYVVNKGTEALTRNTEAIERLAVAIEAMRR